MHRKQNCRHVDDICLIPLEKYDDINLKSNNVIIINFNSFGELNKKLFDNYMNSFIIKNARFMFTVNRIDSFPSFKNNITFLDYNLSNFKKILFGISPLHDYYYERKNIFFVKQIPFSSRMFEFIGEKK